MAGELDLCQAFMEAHPADAGRAIERLPATQAAALIEAMPPATAARALSAMAPTVAADSPRGSIRPRRRRCWPGSASTVRRRS